MEHMEWTRERVGTVGVEIEGVGTGRVKSEGVGTWDLRVRGWNRGSGEWGGFGTVGVESEGLEQGS